MGEEPALTLLNEVRATRRKVRRAQVKVRTAQTELDEAEAEHEELVEKLLARLTPARAAEKVAAVPRPVTPEGSTFVTSSDIARMAGVGRASVSNWKRRHPDFPVPTDDSEPPRYVRHHAEMFLRNHGYLSDDAGDRST